MTNPEHKITITLGEANGLFLEALNKLSSLNIHSARDAYALMRTAKLLGPMIDDYRKCYLELLKRSGARQSLDPLREQLQQAKGKADEKAVADLESKLRQLEPMEQFTMSPTDPSYAQFLAEAHELAQTPVLLEPITRKFEVLVESLPDRYFSPAEMLALEPIVDWDGV